MPGVGLHYLSSTMQFDEANVVGVMITAVLNIWHPNCTDVQYTVNLQRRSRAVVTSSASIVLRGQYSSQRQTADAAAHRAVCTAGGPKPCRQQRTRAQQGWWCSTGHSPTTCCYSFSWCIQGLDSVGVPKGRCSSAGVSYRDACDPLLRLRQQALDFALAEGIHWCHQSVTKQRSCRRSSADCTAAVTMKKMKKEIDHIFARTLQLQEPEALTVPKEGQAGSVLIALGDGGFWWWQRPEDCDCWHQRRAPSSSAALLLQNRFSTLVAEGKLSACPTKHLSHSVVPGGSDEWLSATEDGDPICWPGQLSRNSCCLLNLGHGGDTTEACLYCYPPCFSVGTSVTARRDLEHINSVCVG